MLQLNKLLRTCQHHALHNSNNIIPKLIQNADRDDPVNEKSVEAGCDLDRLKENSGSSAKTASNTVSSVECI